MGATGAESASGTKQMKAPSTKIQDPEKHQAPSSDRAHMDRGHSIHCWSLKFDIGSFSGAWQHV
jgi:hypothetical protein